MMTKTIKFPEYHHNNYDNTWTITQPGAGTISIHFSRLETEQGWDYVYIYDKNNNEIDRYDGYYTDIWTPPVPGDTIKIRLKTDDSVPRWGFKVDKYAYAIKRDTIPPGQITNLQTSNPQPGSITLTWTAPGNDGHSGTANQYDIRYSTAMITDSTWDTTTQCQNEPAPAIAGSQQSFVVTGLQLDTRYYFAIKTKDDKDNWSVLSNVAIGTTTTNRLLKLIIRPVDVNGQVQDPWHYGQADENSYLLADGMHQAEVKAEVIIDTNRNGIIDTGEQIDTQDNGNYVTFRIIQGWDSQGPHLPGEFWVVGYVTFGTSTMSASTTTGITINGIATGLVRLTTSRYIGNAVIRAESPRIPIAISTTVDSNPADGLSNPSVRNTGSRILQQGISGYDVERLQRYLEYVCYDFGVDGVFGPHTAAQVIRFKRANQGTWLGENQLNPPREQVNRDIITNILNHKTNLTSVLNADTTVTINQQDSRFPTWRRNAANNLTNLPNGIITNIPQGSTDREELLRGIIHQESNGIHWRNRRIALLLGVQIPWADITISPTGALGFIQVQPFNSRAYNNAGSIPANTNLYAPDGNLLAGAYYANVPCLSRSFVTRENAVAGDDNVDLLAKALAGYNGSPYLPYLRSFTWHQIVEGNNDHPDGLISIQSIRYAITIKRRLGLQLKPFEQEWLNNH